MTYNYDKPPGHPDALPDKPWQTADGRFVSQIFTEESLAKNDDGHLHIKGLQTGRLSSDEFRRLNELGGDLSRYGVGWMTGPAGQPIAIFGKGSPREGQPVPVEHFPHLTAKVVKRALRGRRPWYKGPSL